MGFWALLVGVVIFLIVIAVLYVRYQREKVNRQLKGGGSQGFFSFALNCGKKAVNFWKSIREDC